MYSYIPFSETPSWRTRKLMFHESGWGLLVSSSILMDNWGSTPLLIVFSSPSILHICNTVGFWSARQKYLYKYRIFDSYWFRYRLYQVIWHIHNYFFVSKLTSMSIHYGHQAKVVKSTWCWSYGTQNRRFEGHSVYIGENEDRWGHRVLETCGWKRNSHSILHASTRCLIHFRQRAEWVLFRQYGKVNSKMILQRLLWMLVD